MQNIALILADKCDENFLRDIRNKNRQFFFDTGYITAKKHHKWLMNELKSCYNFNFIITLNKKEIGTIGILNADFKNHIAELGRFVIMKEFRNLNYGKKVISLFKKICKSLKITEVYLYTRLDNFNALEFYKTQNFIDKKKQEKDKLRLDLRL